MAIKIDRWVDIGTADDVNININNADNNGAIMEFNLPLGRSRNLRL